MTPEFASLLKLSRADRLQLIADLWESITQENSVDLPIADWEIAELLRRRERFLQNPSSGRTWEEVHRHARERSAAR